MVKLVQTADVIVDSNRFNDPDGNDPPVAICDSATDPGDVNFKNCPSPNSSNELLCRLFSIVPLAGNLNDLADLTVVLDDSTFDLTGGSNAIAGNSDGISTINADGCKTDQCEHADGGKTPVTFSYDAGTTIINATCACDGTGETAVDPPDVPAEPFKCKCDDSQGNFQISLIVRIK